MLFVQSAGAAADESRLSALVAAGHSPELSALLIARGVDTPVLARRFFAPCAENLHDPFLLDGVEAAAERIRHAMEKREPIAVFGDYDVDGLTATAMLARYFAAQGIDVQTHIPSRHGEGYGLNEAAIERMAQEGVRLLITVDCGVSSHGEIALASRLGIDVIVTDHHECPPELPGALAVVDPKRGGQAYPFDALAGVGVAAKLIHALSGARALESFADLIAVGTIGDIVPLLDENRDLAHIGLEKLRSRPIEGFRALAEAAGVNIKSITSTQVAYGIAPRINAAGRMGDARRALELLISDDPGRCKQLALELDAENRNRQQVEALAMEQALEALGESGAQRAGIVLADARWREGILGIVASRLVERLHRPVLLMSIREDGRCVGSGRSVPGLHLQQALSRCEDLLVRFGGHSLAAGWTLEIENLEAFSDRIERILREQSTEETLLPKASYDLCLDERAALDALLDQIERLEPVGHMNPRPRFLYRRRRLCAIKRVGANGEHARLSLEMGGDSMTVMAFRAGDGMQHMQQDHKYDIIVQLERDTYGGANRVRGIAQAIRPTPEPDALLEDTPAQRFRFARALCDGILHNAAAGDGPRCSISRGTLIMALQALRARAQGVVIACFTFEFARDVLSLLHAEGLLERVGVRWHTPGEEFSRENVVLLAPHWKAVSALPGSVFCPDLPFLPPCLPAGYRIRTIECVQDSALQIDRERFAAVYRAIAALRRPAADMLSYCGALSAQSGQSPQVCYAALRTFEELGLIEVTETRSQAFAKPVIGAAKRALSESRLFAALSALTDPDVPCEEETR